MKLLAKVSKQINTIIPASNTIYEVICNRVMWSRISEGCYCRVCCQGRLHRGGDLYGGPQGTWPPMWVSNVL